MTEGGSSESEFQSINRGSYGDDVWLAADIMLLIVVARAFLLTMDNTRIAAFL